MSTFDQRMTKHQVKWREANIVYPDMGEWRGKQYNWILPKNRWKDGLWHGIRSGFESLPAYITRKQIEKNSDAHNLKSSWMLCANLYFPFGQSVRGRELLAEFLHNVVHSSIDTVDKIELEYAETGHLHPALLLGEVGGRRGAGQTSPDIAFLVNGSRGLVLTEVKFIENSFYRCSARRPADSHGRPGNPDPDRCNNALAVLNDPNRECHQVAWGRKYWEHLAPVIRRDMLLGRCPAAEAGYQLFRQQALAEGVAASARYDLVVSSVAIDERNEALRTCLKSIGKTDIRQWGELFKGKAGFVVFTHQQWIEWVRTHDATRQWTDWLHYIEDRYDYTP